MSRQEAIRNAIISRAKRLTYEGVVELSRFRGRQRALPRPKDNRASHPVIMKGDTVMYTNQNALYGKIGKVLKVDKHLYEAFVENVNSAPEMQQAAQPDGKEKEVIIDQPRPIPLQHLSLLDPRDKEPTDAKWGNWKRDVRLSTRTGRMIPFPKVKGEDQEIKYATAADTNVHTAMEQTYIFSESDVWEPPFPRDLTL